MNILKKLFSGAATPELTLGSIVSTFTKTVADLEKFEGLNGQKVAENTATVVQLENQIQSLEQTNDALIEESAKAKTIRAKIQALISA